jgi:hypothetical protein
MAMATRRAMSKHPRTGQGVYFLTGECIGRLRAATNRKKKRRPAEANRHLPVNSRPLIELLTIGGHDRQQ